METLAERIARDGPVSELDAIGWAIRLAKRLEALHVLGVAHGSVSPACVTAAGGDRNARAYLVDVQHTSPSPPYQSPERILGGDISAADDVWALAATLYALLTGQSPFSPGGAAVIDADLRQKILAASPPPLAVYDVGDDDLQHILDHAFAREIGQRTASISAFRRALEEWHPDRGVANLPPLDDDDASSDDEDGGRTMLVHDPGGFMRQAIRDGGGATAGAPAEKVRESVPRVNDDEDDDDDDVRTMMRSLPSDDLAAIVARATATADARRVASAASVATSPGHVAGYGRPAPAPPVVAPLPKIADEDSEDVRTVMQTSEQMAADESMLHRNGHGGYPQKASGPQHQPGPAPSPVAHWGQMPASAATLALPAEQDFPEPYLSGPQGTQKIPAGFMLGALPLAPESPAVIHAFEALGHPGERPENPVAMGGPSPAAAALVPQAVGSGARTGFPGLLLAAMIAVVLAAAATFAFLKLKGL